MSWQLAAEGTVLPRCLYVRLCWWCLSARRLTSYKPLVKILLNYYNLSAVGDKDELITLWGEKVKGHGHSEIFRQSHTDRPFAVEDHRVFRCFITCWQTLTSFAAETYILYVGYIVLSCGDLLSVWNITQVAYVQHAVIKEDIRRV